MRDSYISCRQCGGSFLESMQLEELESTIIGFICKECYSDDYLREEIERLKIEWGTEE